MIRAARQLVQVLRWLRDPATAGSARAPSWWKAPQELPDAELAQQIHGLTFALNLALRAGSLRGWVVDATVDRERMLGHRFPVPQVATTALRVDRQGSGA